MTVEELIVSNTWEEKIKDIKINDEINNKFI